jgi:hypothetical protein
MDKVKAEIFPKAIDAMGTDVQKGCEAKSSERNVRGLRKNWKYFEATRPR